MRLYVVRHAAVTVRQDVPPERWHLSPEGRAGASALGEDPCWADVALLYTSPEPKAVATAQRIAARNEKPIAIEHALREVARPWTSGDYRELVRRYLAGDAVDGWEARAAALDRVRAAVDAIHECHADEDVGVVSHGLVLTLWLAELLGLDTAGTFGLWDRIRFPDVAVVDPDARTLERDFGG